MARAETTPIPPPAPPNRSSPAPPTPDPPDSFVIDAGTLARGLDYDAYRAGCMRNVAVMDEVHRDPAYTAEELDLLARLPPLEIAILAEDWCPDVFHTVPTWVRITEQLPGWSYRIFRRDEHPALMDHFVQDSGSRSLPVYAFFDDRHRLRVWWSGRGREAQAEVDRLLDGRSFIDLSPADREAVGKAFERSYRERLRRANFLEIVDLLRTYYHL